MFDFSSPVSQKTFIAVLPVGYTPSEKIPYPVEWRLELFDSPTPEKNAPAKYYADKILPGETGTLVLTRIMNDVFGVTKWQALSAVEEGNVPDGKGTPTPRIRVEVAIPVLDIHDKQINGLWPVWALNNRLLSKIELDTLAHWHATFLSTTKQVSQKDFDGSLASLTELDRVITESWGGSTPQMPQSVVSTFGAYVGEILIKKTGGRWVMKDGVFMVQVPSMSKEALYANVFAKTWKRFMNGEEDSLVYYAVSTIKIAKEGLPQ